MISAGFSIQSNSSWKTTLSIIIEEVLKTLWFSIVKIMAGQQI